MRLATSVAVVLDRTEFPQSTPSGTAPNIEWSWGWGLTLDRDTGNVLVWCNPGPESRDPRHESERMADHLDMHLTFAGFRTAREPSTTVERVRVLRPPRIVEVARRAEKHAKVFAGASIVLSLVAVFQGKPGSVLLSMCLLFGSLVMKSYAETTQRAYLVKGMP